MYYATIHTIRFLLIIIIIINDTTVVLKFMEATYLKAQSGRNADIDELKESHENEIRLLRSQHEEDLKKQQESHEEVLKFFEDVHHRNTKAMEEGKVYIVDRTYISNHYIIYTLYI
jgi:hypothetical protein